MDKQDKPGFATYTEIAATRRGTGPGSAGQSGDTQGLSDMAGAGDESIEELVQEGQYFEAEILSGVEEATEGVAEVHTRQVPEDDVPAEYLDQD